jgi:acyl carrier protein
MEKQLILDAFRDSIQENSNIYKAVYGDSRIPENIEETVLTISSLNFVDLLIDVERRLGFEFADECLAEAKTKIVELVKIIERKIS